MVVVVGCGAGKGRDGWGGSVARGLCVLLGGHVLPWLEGRGVVTSGQGGMCRVPGADCV